MYRKEAKYEADEITKTITMLFLNASTRYNLFHEIFQFYFYANIIALCFESILKRIR